MEELDMEKIPREPPEGLVDMLISTGKLTGNALVYGASELKNPLTGEKEKKLRVTCSACHKTFYADPVVSLCAYGGSGWEYGGIKAEGYKKVQCPECGAIGINISKRNFYNDEYSIDSLHTCSAHAVDGRLVICEWNVSKKTDKKASAFIETYLVRAYVLEQRKMVLYEIYWNRSDFRRRANCYDNTANVKLLYGLTPALLEGTTAENSKLDLYMKGNGDHYPISYLRLWQKRPNVENIVMQGGAGLLTGLMEIDLNDRIEGKWYGNTIKRDHRPVPKIESMNWKERRPSKMLGLSPEEFRWCLKMGWDAWFYEDFITAKKAGIRLKQEDVELCIRLNKHELDRIVEKKMPVMKTVRYLLRQRKKFPEDKCVDVTTLEDYWKMAEKVKFDLQDPSVRWPQRLKASHDRAMQLQKYAEEKELIDLFAQRFEELSVYSWESDGILIRPARNQSELTAEGEKLHHCVGGYAKRHAQGNTAIFFIRRVAAPDEPWFTLELNEKTMKVNQNRGNHNCARTKEITAFEEKWLSWALSQKKLKNRKENVA